MKNVPDILIERAVELWRRALIGGGWDSGDTVHNAFAALTAPSLRKPDHELAANRWAELVVERLKFLRDHDGEKMPEAEWEKVNEHYTRYTYYFDRVLSVDYHPSTIMAKAAEQVGIHDMLFPCKSNVQMSYTDHVSAQFGYGAKSVNHYPLPDGRWLITDLSGVDDMPKVIDAIMSGAITGFEIEDPQQWGII